MNASVNTCSSLALRMACDLPRLNPASQLNSARIGSGFLATLTNNQDGWMDGRMEMGTCLNQFVYVSITQTDFHKASNSTHWTDDWSGYRHFFKSLTNTFSRVSGTGHTDTVLNTNLNVNTMCCTQIRIRSGLEPYRLRGADIFKSLGKFLTILHMLWPTDTNSK